MDRNPPVDPLATKPSSLHARALDDLRYIRQTMERAGSFTAISGWGVFLVGATAVITAVAASHQSSPDAWMRTWLSEAVLALGIAVFMTDQKARAAGIPLFLGPGQRFALGFAPPAAATALLTFVLYRQGLFTQMPGLWLLLYGSSLVTGGAFSVAIVRLLGLLFMLLGAAAFVAPDAWGNAFMAVGFGGLHLLFGIVIARRHGG